MEDGKIYSHKKSKNINSCARNDIFFNIGRLIYIRTNNSLVINRYSLSEDYNVLGLGVVDEDLSRLMPIFSSTKKYGELKTPNSASKNLSKEEFEKLYQEINCIGGLIKIIRALNNDEFDMSNMNLKDCENCKL